VWSPPVAHPRRGEHGAPREGTGGARDRARRRAWRSGGAAPDGRPSPVGKGREKWCGSFTELVRGRAREKVARRRTEGEVHGAERSGELGHNSGERFPGRGSFTRLTEASTRCAMMSRRCGRDGGFNGELGRLGERAPARRGARWRWRARSAAVGAAGCAGE
jgi:hypothetical protein